MAKKYVCLLMLLIFGFGFKNVFAYDVKSDYTKDIVSISGAAEPKEYVTLLVLKKDEDYNSFLESNEPGNLILYNGQTVADLKGNFLFEFPYDGEQHKYNAYITSESEGTKNEIIPFVSNADYCAAISALNAYAAAGDRENFRKTIEDNDVLFDCELNSSVDLNSVSDMFFNYAKENVIDKNSKERELVSLYKTFLVIQAVNEGDSINFDDWTEVLCVETDIKDFVKEITADNNTKAYFNNIIRDKKVSELKSFEDLLKEASILAKVRYPGGYVNAKKVLQKYSGFIGISGTAKESVYISISGQAYKSITELKNAFNEYSKNSPGGSGSSGGSSGGGGGGGAGGSSSPAKKNTFTDNEFFAEKDAAGNNKSEKVDIKFKDIDGFRWANTAIVALADKGIISGRNEERFCPEDLITREEFIKIIIEAMGIAHKKSDSCKFSDVNNNEWYAEYVQTAYDRKIINGISEESFGVGKNITRQDIAVIMYNAAKLGENDLASGGVDFVDKNEFADYAADAICAISSIGVIKGYETGEFKPNDFANRAEAAQIVYGMLKFLNRS